VSSVSSSRPSSSNSSSVAGFGTNEWLVEEMYQQYLADPSSVDQAWHEFFADYRPGSPVGGGDRVAPVQSPDGSTRTQQQTATAQPAPAPSPDSPAPAAAAPTDARPDKAAQAQQPQPQAQVSPAPADAFWYYCPSSKGYYPSVQTCPEPWVKVPPRQD
jgi:2-oxoglutarate decarboxylase